MRRVNQDALENAFSAVRRSCGFNDSPQAQHVGIAVKYFCARKSLDAISGANCELHSIDEEQHQQAEEDQDIVVYPSTYHEDGAVFVNSLFYDSTEMEEEEAQYDDPLSTPYDTCSFAFEPLDMDGELPALPELNGLTYILGYAAGQIPHSKCKAKLSLDHNSKDVQQERFLFSRLKHHLEANGFTFPNERCLTMGVTLLTAFEQKFMKFLHESKSGVKHRLKEYVTYEEYKDVTCCKCFQRFVDCVLNTLIKAQIAKMMHVYNTRNSTDRRSRKKKANRMGIRKTVKGTICRKSRFTQPAEKSLIKTSSTSKSTAANKKKSSPSPETTPLLKPSSSRSTTANKQKSSKSSETTPLPRSSIFSTKLISPTPSTSKSMENDHLFSLNEYCRNAAELKKSMIEISALTASFSTPANDRLVKR